MRGVIFLKPFEYQVESQAEELCQGSLMEGTLTLTNRGEDVPDARVELALAYGDFKKVKAGHQAFEEVSSQVLGERLALKTGESTRISWRLELPFSGPATTRFGSLFLLYGRSVKEEGGFGRLDLQVGLAPAVVTFLTVVETRFSFTEGGRRFANGFMETELIPPGNFPTLEELILKTRLDETGLNLVFAFQLKAFARGAQKGVQKRLLEVSRHIPADLLMLNPSTPNRPLFQQLFRSVLEEATPAALVGDGHLA
ncbi:MAG: hypothetical protein OEW12_03745 [Deltaproteobacteria bacterium]|nr:hypothetical protein [Deltaproteobacteria bacterium]